MVYILQVMDSTLEICQVDTIILVQFMDVQIRNINFSWYANSDRKLHKYN